MNRHISRSLNVLGSLTPANYDVRTDNGDVQLVKEDRGKCTNLFTRNVGGGGGGGGKNAADPGNFFLASHLHFKKI